MQWHEALLCLLLFYIFGDNFCSEKGNASVIHLFL